MIDLRSDTVTRPSAEMLETMLSAELGDDVYGEDPTVNHLQEQLAGFLGKNAALFVSSGTQSNLLALLSHCERGDEYIAGQEAHTYKFEAGGGAVLGGIQPQPLPFNQRGELDLDEVKSAIKPRDFHFARTKLVCLENTQAGKALDMNYLNNFSALMKDLGLNSHLDGARLFNATTKLKVSPSSVCSHFDSISICLSKGLGCPVGSLLAGDKETIQKARRWRKMLGGGMRQAGILAAAGIYALEHHIDRLEEDHQHASLLGAGLQQIEGFSLLEPVATNMVFLDIAPQSVAPLKNFLNKQGILISSPRLVIHRDISRSDLDQVLAACSEFSQALQEPVRE